MQTSIESWIPPAATVPEAIKWWAAATPDATALLHFSGEPVSYGELQGRIDAFGRRLAALGISRRDRVVLALPDGVAAAIAGLAAMRVAIAVPVNPTLPVSGVTPLIAALNPAAVIVSDRGETSWREAARLNGVPVLEIAANGALGDPTLTVDTIGASLPEPAPADMALILLTSGTTDRPRRVPVRHDTLLDTCSTRVSIRGYTREDRGLSVAPAYFVLGLARIVEALLAGGSAIVTSAEEMVRQPEAIRDLGPTWSWMSPAVMESVLEAALVSPAVAEWPLRFVRVGGAQVTPALIARGEALWRVPVLNGYGSTETLGFIASEENLAAIPRKVGTVGLPRPGMEIAIREATGAPLPAGAAGEITVRGGTVFPGYLDDPDATAAAFWPGGWYRTGDLGYLDEDGYLFVTGRVREMINRGGEKIAPAEIDEVLRLHPGVADAAAFALPDKRLGEDIAAAVVQAEGATLTRREMRRWMLDRLAPHKTPRRIWFVDALPRTGTGKVQRLALSERFRTL